MTQQPKLGIADVPILARMVAGVLIGCGVAALLSLYVGVRHVLGSSALENYGVTFIQVVAGYFVAGTWGGVVIGALVPLGRTLGGRLVLSIIGAMIIYGAIDFAIEGSFDPGFTSVVGVLAGSSFGVLWHRGASRAS